VRTRDVLAAASARLGEAGVASPEHDAAELLAHVLGTERSGLALVDEVGAVDLAAYDALVGRRAAREPLQHLTGVAWFRHVSVEVGPGVFTPRPETELLAGWAIEAARSLDAPVVVDLCTGSGAIALAVADEVPQARVIAVELGPDAVAWARRNVERLGLGARVDVRAGDAARADAGVLVDVAGQVDVVAANPPYIPPDADPVEPEVRDHDPALALYGGGDDGLAVPRAVVATAARLLRPGGLLLMEHGELQGAATRAFASGPDWAGARTERDLTGRDRALVAVRS
jgi:release factor glutamine methyltransferase